MIAGATATGKTALSVDVARAIPGTQIISADSRQVYRGMDVGTAKASPAQRAEVPHHGLDLVEPDEPFSVAHFQRHAYGVLEEPAGSAPLVILVGGTGLYLRAVGRRLPLDEAPADASVRAQLEEQLERHGVAPLVAELRNVAPSVAAATDLANPRRVVRALERARLAGDRVPPRPLGYPGRSAWVGLAQERAAHDDWIAERARDQFASGLLEEAQMLRSRFPEDLRAFSAFGYREAFDVLAGRTPRDAAVERTIVRTRAFARRQRTWFRSETGIRWLAPGDEAVRETVAIASELIAARP